jgi:hypothetical protein
MAHLAKRLTEEAAASPGADGAMSEPGETPGAQETALQPIPCASKMSAPQWPSSALQRQHASTSSQNGRQRTHP